ncbi:MAG TPA: amine dehydrogenase large subunit [Steroidobacteraceae bacterium]|nr:amine dehydrogenase large subunit [Steroidobacteraceae bacterium]
MNASVRNAAPRRLTGAGLALGRGLAAGLLALGLIQPSAAVLPNDPMASVQALPATISPHWVWVNDIVFSHMANGKAMLVDGDNGRFLGELDVGFGSMHVVLSLDGKVIFSPETYFSRGTRGDRTDVVTLYDPVHLAPIGEIVIPPKRSSNMPMMANATLTDDGRFLLIYNFTPAQSISVVDTRSRTFAGEIDTPGCALTYPTGARSFFSVCADGTLLDVRLDESGHATSQQRTAQMFQVQRDPVTEKAVRVRDTWYFVSYDGMLYPINISKSGLTPGPTWSLLSAADTAQKWRPGGLQQLAAQAGLNRLYSIMHQGPRDTHKDPGKEVWVYDLARHARIQKIAMKNDSGSIQVTHDAHPLLFSAFIESNILDVYDASSGAYLRSVKDIGTTPTVLVTP